MYLCKTCTKTFNLENIRYGKHNMIYQCMALFISELHRCKYS